jgi:hypothetical protein
MVYAMLQNKDEVHYERNEKMKVSDQWCAAKFYVPTFKFSQGRTE